MAIKLGSLGGTDWGNGEALDADDLVPTINLSNNTCRIITSTSSQGVGLIKFADAVWSAVNDRTTDSGVTWSGQGYGNTAGEDIGFASSTVGVSADQSDASTAFSTNSGSSWAASSTQPGLTTIEAVSISGAVAVVGGDDGANRSIYFSSDSGDNFSESTTGPTVEVRAITMASTTIGYALDGGDNIWKTTDGGDNWTDTTDNLTGGHRNIVAPDTDTFYSALPGSPTLKKYVNSTNTISTIINYSNLVGKTSNLVITDSGYICFAFLPDQDTAEATQCTFFIYDGTDIFTKSFLAPVESGDTSWRTSNAIVNSLIAVGDVLHLNFSGEIISMAVI